MCVHLHLCRAGWRAVARACGQETAGWWFRSAHAGRHRPAQLPAAHAPHPPRPPPAKHHTCSDDSSADICFVRIRDSLYIISYCCSLRMVLLAASSCRARPCTCASSPLASFGTTCSCADERTFVQAKGHQRAHPSGSEALQPNGGGRWTTARIMRPGSTASRRSSSPVQAPTAALLLAEAPACALPLTGVCAYAWPLPLAWLPDEEGLLLLGAVWAGVGLGLQARPLMSSKQGRGRAFGPDPGPRHER